MAYSGLNNTRAGWLGQVTKIQNFAKEFEVGRSNEHELKQRRDQLIHLRTKHEETITKLYEHADAIPERIDEDMEKFSEKFFTTLSLIEEKLAAVLSTTKARIDPTLIEAFQDELDSYVLQLGEYEVFIESYNEEKISLGELQVRYESLKPLQDQYNKVFSKVFSKSHPAAKETLKEARREFEANFFRTLGWYSSELAKRKPQISSTSAQSSVISSRSIIPRLKLPTIELPKFDGSPDLWINFRDTFKSLVHNNAELTGSTKFRYLKTSITDKHSPIAHLLESDEGYDDAWTSVMAFYDDKRKIIDRHFNSMITAKRMTGETHEELQRIVNEYTVNITALERLYTKAELYDALLANFVSHRLDSHTRDLWETENDSEIPMWPKLKIFLEKRRKILTSMSPAKVPVKLSTSSSSSFGASKGALSSGKTKTSSSHVSTKAAQSNIFPKCSLCDDKHRLNSCNKFIQLSIPDRTAKVKELNVCTNCFGSHSLSQCTSKYKCRSCNESHHTMLHVDMDKNIATTSHHSNTKCNAATKTSSVALLQTAKVLLQDTCGEWHELRALLDGASESHYMTSNAARALKLSLLPTCIEAFGIGANKSSIINHHVIATVSDRSKAFQHATDFLVIDNITGLIPHTMANVEPLGIPSNLFLADPTFNVPGRIDILIGTEMYLKLLIDGRMQLAAGPILQNTVFGWVIGGLTTQSTKTRVVTSHHSTLGDIRESVEKFYKLEDYRNDKRFLTEEEAYCERVFEQTHQRAPNGRFVIQIPFKENLNELANNYRQTLCQFLANEKRLQKNPELLEKYVEFMREYESLGHMERVDISGDDPKLLANYLAHHPVIKPESSTTSVRIVFNASAKTSSGLSLNDTQCVGPQIQSDGFILNLRFRQHAIIIKADIAKMYRQIEVVPHQRKLQRIFWRETPQDTLKIYDLKTVTYGTASASFQSTRCLKQLAIENFKSRPAAAKEIDESMFVDDLITGAESISSALELTTDIINIISSAAMKLRKFNSNDDKFLSHIPEADRESAHTNDTTIKALGIKWNPTDDTIEFDVKPINFDKITKRTILSEIAKTFDPLGLLGPVIFMLKLIMKKVYNLHTPWDDKLPDTETSEWIRIASTMHELRKIRINRHAIISTYVSVQLHGFSDASNNGYGAVIYVRSEDSNGNTACHIICAKSRIAPNDWNSIARLELCGCLILSHLMTRVEKAFTIAFDKKVCWLDSAIVLHWLKKSPSQLQTFVANRVSEIQSLSKDRFFRHVKGNENPADLISRGLMPNDIIDNTFWWCGPKFLAADEESWPSSIVEIDPEDPNYKSEFKKIQTFTSQSKSIPVINPFVKMIDDFSSARRLKMKFAYILRFIYNIHAKKNKTPYRSGPINIEELLDAEIAIARINQITHFPEEFKAFSNDKPVSSNSRLKNLNPQWDKTKKIIRVGGRLSNAGCDEDQKHPIILPSSHFTTLMINEVHEKNFHSGQQATLGIIRQRFWPLRAKQLIRKVLHKCVKCFRARPQLIKQFMGSLPAPRTNPAPVFFNTGVDFAGPLNIKLSSVRNAKTGTAFIALFVCLATKAIHLEIVSALSTKAFLSTFDRFISRRGLPKTMHSDNGTNFVGAANDLRELYKFINQDSVKNEINNHLNQQEIEWKFIPPRAPEHGGLWEAGVKSMKYHLKRVTSNALLTFEELNTVICKIEAILNSRPLTAISDDPNDLSVLTAGHFLIGRPLIAKPDRDFTETPINRLERWDRIIHIQQHFWQRWRQDYLHQLQVRVKNYKEEVPVKIGQLVLLHIDNIPPLQWPIGRIVSIFPGKDGITRVAKIKTAKGWLERPVTKLAILPIGDDQTSSREDVRQH